MQNVKDNSSRARTAYIVNMMLLGAICASLLAILWQLYSMHQFENGSASLDDLALSDKLVQATVIIELVAHFLNIVVFLRWFRRAYYNLHQVNPLFPTWSEGWASGAWFVPFVNLVRPYKIMREIWEGTGQALSGVAPMDVPKSILGIWWACLMFSSLANNISFRLARSIESFSDLRTVHGFGITGDILSIIGLTIAGYLIRRFTPYESRLQDLATLPQDSIFYPGMPDLASAAHHNEN